MWKYSNHLNENYVLITLKMFVGVQIMIDCALVNKYGNWIIILVSYLNNLAK